MGSPGDIFVSAAAVEKKLAPKPEIAKAFIPTFAVGCRRCVARLFRRLLSIAEQTADVHIRSHSLTPGPGYLEALTSDNVDFVSTGIKRITETGIETVDGKHREYDTIVSATGCVRPRLYALEDDPAG